MSGVKHTPGPWETREVRTQVGRAFRIGAGEMLEAGKGCCIIYDDYCGNPDNERKANALLIASAPCMFEYILSSAQNGCATAQEIVTRATGDRPEKGGAL